MNEQRPAWDRTLVPGQNSFDVLRVALASLVIFEHAFWLTTGGFDTEPLYRLTGGQFDSGSLGVDSFFIVSGFLVTMSYQNSSGIASFLRKRVLRIYPAYLVIAMLSLPIFGGVAASHGVDLTAQIRPPVLLANLITLGNPLPYVTYFPSNAVPDVVLGTLWSIRYEFDCYLLVALLGISRLLKPTVALLLFVVALGVYSLQQFGVLVIPPDLGSTGIAGFAFGIVAPWPRLITFFLAGMAFYLCRAAIPKSAGLALASAGAVIILTTAHLAWLGLAIGWTYCLLWAALARPGYIHVAGRPLDLSYGMYLLGFPVEQVLLAWVAPNLTPLVLFVAAMIVTAILAAVSWLLIERPAISMARKRTWPNFGLASFRGLLARAN